MKFISMFSSTDFFLFLMCNKIRREKVEREHSLTISWYFTLNSEFFFLFPSSLKSSKITLCCYLERSIALSVEQRITEWMENEDSTAAEQYVMMTMPEKKLKNTFCDWYERHFYAWQGFWTYRCFAPCHRVHSPSFVIKASFSHTDERRNSFMPRREKEKGIKSNPQEDIAKVSFSRSKSYNIS